MAWLTAWMIYGRSGKTRVCGKYCLIFKKTIMKKTACLLIIMLLWVCPAYGLEWSASHSLGLEQLRGDTSYEVEGRLYHTHGPSFESELEFPLDCYLFSAEGELKLGDKFSAVLTIKTNLSNDPGKTADTDRISTSPGIDIYSESDTELEAWLGEGKLRYKIYEIESPSKPKISAFVGAGLLFQDFAFDVSNTLETYPASGDPPIYVAGPTLEYDLSYIIPLVELAGRFQFNNKTSLDISMGYSPYALAEDKDKHLLKDTVSESYCEGWALQVSCEGRYNFYRNWFATGQVEILSIKTSGESDTYRDGRYSHTLDQQTSSLQSSYGFKLGYQF